MTDKRYRIRLEVITPLHVGTGNENDWVRGADYAQNGKGKVYVIDIRKAVENNIGIADLFMANVNNNNNGIESLDDRRLESISKYIFNSPESTNNNIKSCLRNQFLDTPVIAGSSLKGAIRSALFRHLAEKDLIKERKKHQNDKQLVKTVFGDMNKGTDFMRFIRISDIEIPNDNHAPNNPGTILVNTKLFNLQNNNSKNEWRGGWKNGMSNTTTDCHKDQFNTLYECVEPGKKGEGAIILSRSSLDLLTKKTADKISYAEEKNNLINSDINELFKVINITTRNYLKGEEAFFNKYDEAANADKIVESIKALQALIPDKDSDTGAYCLLKMSAGVGFHAITGNWIYDDFIDTGTNDGKKNKKSRKIALFKGKDEKPYLTGFELMGFVMLRIITEKDAEYDKLLNEANALMKDGKWQDAYKKVQEAIKKCPTRKEHIGIQEQCEDLKKEEYKKAALKRYQEYIQEAVSLKNAKRWREAKSKAELAKGLNVNQTEHQKIIEECEKAIRYSEPLSDLIKSGMKAGTIIGTIETWKSYNNTFGDKEYKILKEALKRVKEKDLKDKQGKLSNAIGESLKNRLFEELFPPKIVEVKKETVEAEKTVTTNADPAPAVAIEENENQHPEETIVNKPQPKSIKEEGYIGKISKWFKNLFK